MDNKKLSFILKAVIIFLAFLGIGTFAGLIPIGLSAIINQYPEFNNFYFPWLIFMIIASIPLFTILILGFLVSSEIGNDNSFSRKNVKRLKGVAYCLLIESIYFFVGNVTLWFSNFNYPIVVLISFILSLFAVAIAIAVIVLAHLIKKAVELREENEAFI